MKKRLLSTFFLVLIAAGLWAQGLRSDTIDLRSFNLKLDLSDFTTKVLRGDATIGIKAKMNGVTGIRLDLLKLNVDSVKINSFTAPYTYNDSVIDVNLLIGLNNGDSATLEVFYHGNPYHASSDFGGFYWTGTYAFNIGVSFLADPHNYGKVWFPCFDNFEQRSLYEFYITTKSNHKAFCNGLLLDVNTVANKKIWHWKLGQSIPSYLASVAVSDYATVESSVNGLNGTIPVQLGANASDTTNLKNLFVHLPDAFHIQENAWGPYLWDRVGYCIVPFNAGAMEHATNIGFMSYYLGVLSDQAETTMAHELSHHWFGNLVTCKTAEDMWLNEGWASYNEHLFLQRLYGDSTYRDAVRTNHENVLHDAHVRDGSYLPVSGVPTESTYGSTVYNKGADVIHTLRAYMGDSLFFNCMKSFLNDYAWQNITTTQLRDYLTQCSGINLNDYFNDWVLAPGFPHFSIENQFIELATIGGQDYMRSQFTIRQKLSHAPHYYSNVPVVVTYFSSTGQYFKDTVLVSGPCTDHSSAYVPMATTDISVVALDFEGNIQDAITDEWKQLNDTGTYDFGTAKLRLQVNSLPHSSFLRVEHNWIRPEPMRTKIAGLHLHDKRYWTFSGTFLPLNTANAGSASARLDFDGTDVSLDNTFITNSEDSIVVMYRANAEREWAIADSFKINTGGNANDKIGSVTINKIKAGQYCLAIWNSALADTTTADDDCTFLSVPEIENHYSFTIYPNPTNEAVTLTFEKNIFDTATLLDITGSKLLVQKISAEQSSLQMSARHLAPGTYLIELSGACCGKAIRKLIKQ